jgi:hypothetical protein
MEDTNESLSKAEYEALVNEKDDENAKPAGNADSTTKDAATKDESSRVKQKLAAVGGPGKKRKAARIIGDEDEADVDGKTAKETEAAGKTSKPDTKRPAKKKKKAKAIALSFGEDGEND